MQLTTAQVIQNWVREAASALTDDRREHGRRPYFRPITIVNGSAGGKSLAFSRDISPGGIGLLHSAPLVGPHISLTVPTIAGQATNIETDIQWSRSCGGDWFLSGGRLINLSAIDVAKLLTATVWSGVNQRLTQRLPFYRPVAIETGRSPVTTLAAITRDISSFGIGLIHNQALETQNVLLTIGQRTRVAAEILWCKPCGSGWYFSGGRFIKPMFEEMPSLFM